MIKRVIERVHTLFKRKPKRGSGREPKRIPASEHHINRELVSRSALRVCETLQKAGHRAYIVGGAVRDLLLDIAPKDFDIAPMLRPVIKPFAARRPPPAGTSCSTGDDRGVHLSRSLT
jgi:poly(A) polymerase